MTGPRVLPGRTTEAAFLKQVIDLCHRCHWRVMHVRHAQVREGKWITHGAGDIAGWPDVFAVRGHRAVALELKTEKGVATAAQLDWLAALGHAGVEAHVVRPSQWDWLMEVLR